METSPLQELKNLAYEKRIKDLETVVDRQVFVMERMAGALGRLTDEHLALKARLESTLETNNLRDGS